ncbi:endo alpha-1,4 polygalactosaminidase [Paenibacillus hexagrammi]|uniref:Endo alpha-1,4 polygalactosaminidase n=1 Tax=Paenibacillus hexagrammi TaxID=2908839 RepID=A0ABY3SN22_9BACL|nr:endo alpha-1,4 polygalactosaminidase [Paenibacillus sp. YPD9-1]UJF35437.1 endo alpha-1,4 polygalactosaminidase [Paenibacillus sp. YPD9-1]
MKSLRLYAGLILSGVMMVAFSQSAAATTVTVDGNPIEWSAIPERYEATTTHPSNVFQLKVTNDTTQLYVLVTGSGLNTKSQLFIDADDDPQTGYHASGFNQATGESTGAEFLVENDTLLRYTGPATGTSRNTWSWTPVITASMVKTDSAIEWSLPLTSLSISESQDVGVAYICNDSMYDRLPSSDDYFAVEYVDLTPPSKPKQLTASPASLTSVQLTWQPSMDESTVAGYDIFRDGVKIGESTAASYTDANALQGSHAYSVKAFDPAGNRSAASTQAMIQLAGVPASTGNWNDLHTYLVNYTDEAQINHALFAKYDAVVLEPKRVSSQLLADLKTINPQLFTIGYLSIGETLPLLTDANGNRLDIYFLDANGNPMQNPDWHGYYIDARKPVFQDLVLNHWLPDLFAQGFDGVFLDTVDTSAYVSKDNTVDFRPSAQGMAALIQQMKVKFPDKKIVMNRGYHLLGGNNDVSGSIDGVMLESYTSTWANSTLKNPDGSSVEDYHIFPSDSEERIWTNGITTKINKLRFQYNLDGTVKRDAAGKPLKASHFFHAMPLDYAKDTTPEQKAIMQTAVQHAWDNYFVPSIGVKNLDLPPAYDWLNEVSLPAPESFGAQLDIPAMPVPSPDVIDSFSTVDNWQTIRGQTDALPAPGADSVVLSGENGAAKAELTIQGTTEWKNGATLQSREWVQPIDLTHGFVSLQAKSSSLLPADKAFEVIFMDENNDAKAFSLTPYLKTDWTTISLDLVQGGSYIPGWDGAQDGFQADRVKYMQIRIMNTVTNSPAYSGTLWIDNILADQSLPQPAPLIDDFSAGSEQWACSKVTAEDSCSLNIDGGALKWDLDVKGTTGWSNGAMLQSRDWFTPVDFSSKTLHFDARASSVFAGTNKSVQVLLVDRNGSTRGWDITNSLSTQMGEINVSPSVGGTDALSLGQSAFDLDQVSSIRFLVINSLSSASEFTGSVWIDNISAP